MLVLAASAAVTSTAASASAAGPPGGQLVRTRDGVVRGTVTSDYRSFQGIPFAAPPVGNLRWAPPQSTTPWKGVRDATTAKPECEQAGGDTAREDCLYLNVWTPPTASARSRLPVLVYIYGGAYRSGSANDYQPVGMVNEGHMLVVTISYRLGALGFLTLPQLDSAGGGDSGNYGLLDQIQALRWVKANIARFGGDASRVTIAGQSAGGESVCTLLASPQAAGLFQGAIEESGLTCVEGNRAASQQRDAAFVTDTGCDNSAAAAVVACLRGKSAAEVLAAQSKAGSIWYPTTGTKVLPLEPPTAFATGRFNHVPVLMGNTAAEGASFIYANNPSVTAAQYTAAIQATFGTEAGEVLARYPVSGYSVPGTAEAAVKTDAGFSCAMLSNAAALTAHVPTYVYEFRDQTAAGNAYGAPEHAAELPYLYGTSGTASLTGEQQGLSRDMIAYWAEFARTDALNAPGLPWVPRYSPAAPREVAFNSDGPQIASDMSVSHQCSFWDQFFANGFSFHFAPGSPLIYG